MKFQLLDILPHVTNPVTGREVSVSERLNQAVTSARYAEQLGLDAVAIGERHAGKVISAGVTVVLGAIASQTSRIRIGSGVTVLSILDPVRVAEDYATLDHAEHGHDPDRQFVGAGAGFLYLADTTQEAREAFGPTYEAMVAYHLMPGNHTPGNEMTFRDIDSAIERGPVLVGSPQQVAEKILWWHEAFGHQLQSFSLPTMIPHEQQLEMLARFASEVAPVVRAAAPSRLWEPGQDAYATRPAFAGGRPAQP